MKDSSLLTTRNVLNETPFHHATRFGHDNTILKLIEHAKSEFGEAGLKELLRQKNSVGETTLHEAARHGHGVVASTMMGEDMELAGLVNDDFVSPLYLATTRVSLDMVAKMLNHQKNRQRCMLQFSKAQFVEATLELRSPLSQFSQKASQPCTSSLLSFYGPRKLVEILYNFL